MTLSDDRRRWVYFAMAMMMQAVAGTAYAFSTISVDLKYHFQLTQQEIQTIGSVANVGQYSSFIAGFIFDMYGPKIAAFSGASICLTGFVLLYLCVEGIIPNAGVSLLSGLFWLAFFGSSFLDTSGLATGTALFPHNRSLAVGILKSLLGLSASLVTIAYSSLFTLSSFLLFLGCLISFVGFIAAVILRSPHAAMISRELTSFELKKMTVLYCFVFVLAMYLLVVSLLENLKTPHYPGYAYGIIPFFVIIIFIILYKDSSNRNTTAKAQESNFHSILPPSLNDSQFSSMTEADLVSKSRAVSNASSQYTRFSEFNVRGRSFLSEGLSEFEHMSGRRASGGDEDALFPFPTSSSGEARMPLLASSIILSPSTGDTYETPQGDRLVSISAGDPLLLAVTSTTFFLITFILCIIGGAGLTVINNLGQISVALGAHGGYQNVFVVVLSVSNCLGRVFAGYLANATAKRVPKAVYLLPTGLMMMVALLVIANANLQSLYVGVVFAGISYGFMFALLPTLIAEFFGMRAFAATVTCCALYLALAGYLFSVVMTSTLYQSHVSPGESNCFDGTLCYSEAMYILAGLVFTSCMASVILLLQTKNHFDFKEGRVLTVREREEKFGRQIGWIGRLMQAAVVKGGLKNVLKDLLFHPDDFDDDDYVSVIRERSRGSRLTSAGFDGDLTQY